MVFYSMQFSFNAILRLRNNGTAPASWHFVTLPKEIGDSIKKAYDNKPKKGRGSVKVRAQIGFCKRETSIFPSTSHKSYLLPIKASVRSQLQIQEGSEVLIYLTCI